MSIPPLKKISIQTVYSGVIGFVIICDNEVDRNRLYNMLDGHKIALYFNEKKSLYCVLILNAGTYSFDTDCTKEGYSPLRLLDDVTVITSGYRSKTGELEYLEPIPIHRISMPNHEI